MKQILILWLLAIVASVGATRGRKLETDGGNDLKIRWHMDEPNITYFPGNNSFVFDFSTSSTENSATEGGMQVVFYDYNCKDDGSGFDEFVIPLGITGPDGSAPEMLSGPDGRPQLTFEISPAILSMFPQIYHVVDSSHVGQETVGFSSNSNRRKLLTCDNDSDKTISAVSASSPVPTSEPTPNPTNHPTDVPTHNPTSHPTDVPTHNPTNHPTDVPTHNPTNHPTDVPPPDDDVDDDEDDYS